MFALYEKKNPLPTEDNPKPSPVYVFQGCKLHIPPSDVSRETRIYLPIGDDVYVKFLLDPSIAERYVDKVIDYERHLKDYPEQFPTDKVQEAVAPPVQKRFDPVVEILAPKITVQSMNFELKPVKKDTDVDVLIVVSGDKISRVEHDQDRVAPPVTLYGLSKEFALDALFQTTLTRKNATQTIKAGLVAKSRLWINNPKPGFSYGLKVQS